MKRVTALGFSVVLGLTAWGLAALGGCGQLWRPLDLTCIYGLSGEVSYLGVSRGDVLKHAKAEYVPFELKSRVPIRSLSARRTTDIWAAGDGGNIMHYNSSTDRA